MATDYFLLYRNEHGAKTAAIPDVEGVYRYRIPFEEFGDKIENNEVIILQSQNLHSVLHDETQEYINCEYVGKFVGSENVVDCIKECGFEEFFTSIIKEYMKQEDPLPE